MKRENLQIKCLTLHLKELEKRTNKSKVSGRKEIMVREEINEMETEKTKETVNEPKTQLLQNKLTNF